MSSTEARFPRAKIAFMISRSRAPRRSTVALAIMRLESHSSATGVACQLRLAPMNLSTKRRLTRGTLHVSARRRTEAMRGPVTTATAGQRSDTLGFVGAVFCASLPLCVVLVGAAQEPRPARLTFDVVSVKRTGPDGGASIVGGGRGQYQAINVPLRVTITNAWNLRDHQIVGAPDWLASDRFDIVAKEPAGTFTDEQRRQMIQALLIERFKLQAHLETREMPLYNLVLLRADGRLGPDLKPTAVDCAALRKERAAGGATPADPPRPSPTIDERVPCNQRGFFGPQGV